MGSVAPKKVAVHWIVDGNNVMGARPDGWWRDRRGAARSLAEAIGRYCSLRQEEVTVVFDGIPDPSTVAAGVQYGVEVRFAPGGPDAADHLIAELVSSHRDPSTLTAVTSDKRLAGELEAYGAEVLGAGAFRAMLEGEGRAR